jgi:chemotaxis protein CheX
MKLNYINPFTDAVQNLFTTMLGSKAEKGKISFSTESKSPYEITALIGLSGEARGTVAISFPSETAIQIVSRFLMIDAAEVDGSVIDGVGEVVNIVAGSAKSKFVSANGKPIDLSLPNVIKGEDYIIEYPSQTTWIEVPFESDLGKFHLRVTFEQNN